MMFKHFYKIINNQISENSHLELEVVWRVILVSQKKNKLLSLVMHMQLIVLFKKQNRF